MKIGGQVLNPKIIVLPDNTSGGTVIHPDSGADVTLTSGGRISASKGGASVLDSPAFITYKYAEVCMTGGNLVLLTRSTSEENYAIQVSTTTLNLDGTSFVTLSLVPEPSSYALMMLGIATFGLRRKHKAN